MPLERKKMDLKNHKFNFWDFFMLVIIVIWLTLTVAIIIYG
jgi:hypothetical protein